MYATSIDRESNLQLDENGSTLVTDTSFVGRGHIGVLKQSSINETGQEETPVLESSEDYWGSFRIYTKIDEYGKNAATNRSVSGQGMVAADRRIGDRQRSYESGTGLYQAEEQIETHTNYMAKDLNVTSRSVNYSYSQNAQGTLASKWTEGMWSRSGYLPAKGVNSSEPASLIAERFSQADYLKKSTVAGGLNQMNTEAEFSGRAQFDVSSLQIENGTGKEIDLEDEYLGRYSLKRSIGIGGVARFDEPHLTVSKVGHMDPAKGSSINYEITVVNDGNRALGPVYVLDAFPPATEYVYSSVRPSSLSPNSVQWTLVSLGIGASSTIDLMLNITEDADSLVNQVQVRGAYDGEWVTASNSTALQLNWLSCCPPELRVSKSGYVDENDSLLVHYRISLLNREQYTMVATIVDQLPAGMQFVNSSLQPSDYGSSYATWNIVDLKPGEVRSIDYLARASYGGTFVNLAHIVAYPLNSSDLVLADATSKILVPADYPRPAKYSSSWQPPACFGLNCSDLAGEKGDWMLCPTCGDAELAAENDYRDWSANGEGYEIP